LEYEIIFVDDDSTDNSLEKLIQYHIQDKRIKIINLSRRFGTMESIMAGIKMSSGDASNKYRYRFTRSPFINS
jgi:glycosyltransferase involved in cell wall biosynthesis